MKLKKVQNHQIYLFDMSTIHEHRQTFLWLKYRMIRTSQRTFLYMLIYSLVLSVLIIWIVFFIIIIVKNVK